MSILIIHHNDADGRASGAIAYDALAQRTDAVANSIRTQEYDYSHDESSIDRFIARSHFDEIYIVDISMSDEFMLRHASRIHWIDHHVSAIQKSEEFDWGGRLKMNYSFVTDPDDDTRKISACELCWRYFHPGEPLPKGIHLIGRNDVWDHSDRSTQAMATYLKFGTYNRTRISDPKNIFRKLLTEPEYFLDRILRTGYELVKYKDTFDGTDARIMAKETTFLDKYKIVYANVGNRNSSFFNPQERWGDIDFFVLFSFTASSFVWRVTVFSGPNKQTPHDVQWIIKHLKGIAGSTILEGGGHHDAGGYITQDIHTDFLRYLTT